MRWRSFLIFGIISLVALGEGARLKEMDTLSPPRRDLIKRSLKAVAEHPGVPYRYGGSSPEEGGMDCSGAVYYLLQLVGIDPPRSSQAQYDWVKGAGNLTSVPPEVTEETDPVFKSLQPGDLLFWARTNESGEQEVSHVQIYLGTEIKDDHPVMVGASDGRAYRGIKKNGFDIVDFKVPAADSVKKLIGFGPPVWNMRKESDAKE